MILQTFRTSISFRAFIVFAGMFLLALTATGLSLEYSLQESKNEQLRMELKHNAEMVASFAHTIAITSAKDNLLFMAEKQLQMVQNIYQRASQNELSMEDAKEQALNALRLHSRGTNGYIYVIDSKGTLLMHQDPKFIDTDVSWLPFIREQKRMKEGFLQYEKPAIKGDNPIQKVLYMVHFLPWDWIISLSDDIQPYFRNIAANDFRASIKAHGIGPLGFFAILSTQGEIIMHPWLSGNVSHVRDMDGKAYIQHALTSPPDYQWIHVTPPMSSIPQKMLLYHEYIPSLDWIIISAGQSSGIQTPLSNTRAIVLGSSALGLTGGLLLAVLFAKGIRKRVDTLVKSLERGVNGDYSVRISSQSSDEFGTLAHLYNIFLIKLSEAAAESARAHKQLEARVQQRTSEIKQRQEQYRLIFESVSDGLIISDAHGKIHEANASAAELFHARKNELKGMDIAGLFSSGHTEIASEILNNFIDDKDTLATPNCIRIDKSQFEAELRSKTLFYEGERHVMIMIRDITEKLHAERERRALARFPDENPSPILRVAADGNILYSNTPANNALGTEGHLYLLPRELSEPTEQCLSLGKVLRKEIAIQDKHYAFTFIPVQEQNYINIHGQDITGRKKIEQALALERQRMTLALEASEAVVFEHAIPAKAETSYLDPRIADMLGLDPDSLPLDPVWWRDRIAPDDRSRFETDYTNFIQGSMQRLHTDLRFHHGDGRWIQLEIYATAVGMDEYGRASRVVGLVKDITHERMVEKSLSESEKWLRTIFNSMQAGILVADIDSFAILEANPVASDLIGLSREELIGKDFSEFIQPGPSSLCISDGSSIRGLSGQGTLINADGAEIPILGNEIVALLGGRRSIVHNFIDITVLKQAEEELRRANVEMELLLSSISSILIGLDANLAIRHWNHKASEIFSIPTSEAAGRTISDLALGWDSAMMNAAIERCQRENSSIRLDEIPFIRADGKKRILGLSLHPIHSNNEAPSGCLLLGNDITDLMLMQHQSLQAQKLESIGQLAAGIAHEINTPTQYVGDNTRFLRDSYEDFVQLIERYEKLTEAVKQGEELSEKIRQIEEFKEEIDLSYLQEEIPTAFTQTIEGVERVSKIVRSMKSFAHPGAQEKVPLDIETAIESTVTISRNEWKYVADLETDIAPDMPPVVCLPDEFNQVILNMIINAAHAIESVISNSDMEKGLITISARADGDTAEIRIKDTGSGIPKDAQSKIFDPFFTTKEVGKGTGQGLNIAHSVIVEKHGGTITFTTEEGKGTTFIIRLPFS